MYKIVFDTKVIKDLKNIDKVWQDRIIEKIEEILITRPYDGKRIVGNMSDLYRIRVEVIKIAHRKEVY